jgi:PIN domain nuclease of toxin-antitoxin system
MGEILLDTNILLKIADNSLSKKGQRYLADKSNDLYFSSVSVWEVAIKSRLRKKTFIVDAKEFYHGLLKSIMTELPVTSEHALATLSLLDIHEDPFDRILIAQSNAEGMQFLTTDKKLKKYSKSVIVC